MEFKNDEKNFAILNNYNSDSSGKLLLKINNYLDTNNIFDFVWEVVDSSIRNEVCNGKQCYRFSYGSGFIYVEKETYG